MSYEKPGSTATHKTSRQVFLQHYPVSTHIENMDFRLHQMKTILMIKKRLHDKPETQQLFADILQKHHTMCQTLAKDTELASLCLLTKKYATIN